MPRFRKTDRKFTIYKQAAIVKQISKRTGYQAQAVAEIMQAAEDVLVGMMFEANEDTDVAIYPFTGIRVKSEYREAEFHTHPTNPDGCIVPEGIHLSADFTKGARRSLERDYRNYVADSKTAEKILEKM